ncbi:MAG: hypothetical protein ACXVXL_09910 [Solirubrobacteraceae bacterium]
MTDQITDAALDERLRSADPLMPGSLPTEADTEAALRRLLTSGQDAGPTRRRVGLRARRARPRVLAAGTAAAVAVGTILALLLGATTSPPAFAVNRNPDGTVTVKLIKLSGVAGANQKLAAIGVRAKIVTALEAARFVKAQHPCQGKPAGAVRTITFDPASIPRRQVLVLSTDRAAHLGYYSAASVHPAAHAAAPARAGFPQARQSHRHPYREEDRRRRQRRRQRQAGQPHAPGVLRHGDYRPRRRRRRQYRAQREGVVPVIRPRSCG